MKRSTCLKIAALLFPLFFMMQPAHALRCIAYVTLDFGRTWACAGYAETSPCEGADQRCLPTAPTRVGPTPPTNPGAPPPGPSPRGGDVLSPEEMSCSQVNQQIAAQQKIIDLLNADIAKATRDLGLADAALAGPLSEAGVNTAAAEKATACGAWENLQTTNTDITVCSEPANNKPPRCRTRKLTSAEQSVKNSCDVKSANATATREGREGALRAKTVNSSIVIAAERKKAIASVNLKKLRDAKGSKANCS
jgi:hypothetical protein